MTSSRKDSLAVLALLALLGFFYPGLFLVKAAPLIGDSLEQHYPWAYQLAQSLKDFKLPFWTPLIQCGFPLVAESQVGAFYLPNLILFVLLPFKMAYSYMNLLHWFVAGWGTYAYAKQMKLGTVASFVAALIFVFGGAYGGAYYNMTSLKTICWFPVALFFLERYLEGSKGRFLLGMAIVIGQSLVAGYLQMAVLTWLIFGVYVFLRIFVFPEAPSPWASKVAMIGILTLTALFALLLALPQIYLTFQLAMASNRAGLAEGYAYVGSMSPAVLGTLIIPKLSLVLRGNNLYSGSFAFFLALFACLSPEIRKTNNFRIWIIMTVLALLLALGQWSPFYVALIKLTKFYSFRFPAKFIGFICFGLAMLGAAGFQVLWQGRPAQAMIRKAFYVYLAAVSVFIAFMAFTNLFLAQWKGLAIKLGEFYVTKFIYSKPGHPHPLATYLEGVKSYPDHVLKYISFTDPSNLWMIVMSGFCVVLIMMFLRKKVLARSLLGVGIFFLMVDLYAASFLDIQFDLAPYQNAERASWVRKALEKERGSGGLGRIFGFRDRERSLPLAPSQNMLYGIEDIGVYSPLVPKRYFESIGLLGNVDDSNYQQFPSVDFVLQRLPLLSFLNVSHILSLVPLEQNDLKIVSRDMGAEGYLYKNGQPHQRAYFLTKVESVQDWDALRAKLIAPFFDPRTILLLEKTELAKIKPFDVGPSAETAATIRLLNRCENLEDWQVEVHTAGFFVVSETFFPGWTATANGRPVPILKADGLFRAIRIDGPGNYKIRFRYRPFSGEYK